MIQPLRYALIAALVGAPASAVDVRYGVSVRTDARARTPLVGDVGTTVTGDLELTPRADLALGVDSSTFSAMYSPTLVWREPQTGGRFLPLHRARLAFDTRWSRANLTVAQEGAYGLTDVGFLRQPNDSVPAGEVQTQTLGIVPYLRSATLLNLEARPNDVLSAGLSAAYLVSGSLESLAMPLQYGPMVSLRARLAVSRTDGLTTQAQASQATFVTGQEQFIAQLWEIWDRQVSRTVSFNSGAGIALTREQVIARQGIPGTYSELLPIALASLSWNDVLAGQPLLLTTSLRMAPFADRFTANVYERIEARVAGQWRPGKDWIATTAVGAAQAVPISLALSRPPAAETVDRTGLNQAGDRALFGEAAVGWTPKLWLLVQASGRVLWTEQPRYGQPGQVQAVATLSVTVQQQDSLAW